MTPARADRPRHLVLAVLVSLLALNAAGFLVFQRIDEGLQTEERERLTFMARTLGLEVARRVPFDAEDEARLAQLGERFESARREAGLEAVLLADRDGLVLIEALDDGVRVRGRLLDAAEQGDSRAAWAGGETFVPAKGEGRQEGGSYFYPIFSLGGEVRYALAMVAGPAFRDRLASLSPMLVVSRAFGLILLLVFGIILLLAARRHLRRGERHDRTDERGDRAPGTDTDFVIQTFQEIVSNLRESESEFKTLYARAEERARYLEKTVAYMLRGLPTGVVIFDRERRVLLMNAAAREVLGLARRDYTGESAGGVFGKNAEFAQLLEDLLAGVRTHSRYEVRLGGVGAGDGDGEAWAGVTTSVVHDPTGSVLGYAFLMADITETKRLRQRVALKDRLSAMGEMSAGLAHELRNSLATLAGYCRLVERAISDPDACRGHLAKLADEVRLLEGTSEGLLEFVRPGRRSVASIDAEDLLMAAVRAVEERSSVVGVAAHTRFAALGARVEGDAATLRKAFENLIENAFQAMPGGGTISIATRIAPATRAARAASEESADRGAAAADVPRQLEIVVEDTGAGIPPERLARVFVPFFTTKERGTGLGLAIVQKTIAEHDGTVEVASRVGSGTTFRVLLPCRQLVDTDPKLVSGMEGF